MFPLTAHGFLPEGSVPPECWRHGIIATRDRATKKLTFTTPRRDRAPAAATRTHTRVRTRAKAPPVAQRPRTARCPESGTIPRQGSSPRAQEVRPAVMTASRRSFSHRASTPGSGFGFPLHQGEKKSRFLSEPLQRARSVRREQLRAEAPPAFAEQSRDSPDTRERPNIACYVPLPGRRCAARRQ
jgi:hypothetical protein